MDAVQENIVGFLDLPVELRLLIYEYLPIQRKEFMCLLHGEDSSTGANSWGLQTMSWLHTSLQILRVSQFIRKEAEPIMTKKLNEIKLAVPRITVEVSMVHQLFKPHGLVTFVTHWYQVLKQTEGQADFNAWMSRQAAYSPLPMFGMLETTLRFIKQAGHQLLGRTQLLESLEYWGDPETASVFFLVQMVDHALGVPEIPSGVFPICSWWAGLRRNNFSAQCMPVQMQNFRSGIVAKKNDCAECMLIWHVAVKTVERRRVRTISLAYNELWDYLGLEERWPTVVTITSRISLIRD